VDAWLARLAAEDTAARRSRVGMDVGRADVIVGGVIILAAVMASWDRQRCLCSEDDILDGLAASLR
jgi:exopolyphosphatase/pppGpp-phosphohydrolase